MGTPSMVSCNGGCRWKCISHWFRRNVAGDYTYLWSNGQTTATATNLVVGSYTVTITDDNGCHVLQDP